MAKKKEVTKTTTKASCHSDAAFDVLAELAGLGEAIYSTMVITDNTGNGHIVLQDTYNNLFQLSIKDVKIVDD